MILYPTETLYALGVNALSVDELEVLFAAKGRSGEKASSWLVRNVEDIAHYGVLSEVAAKIAQKFLPGQLTLVLPVKEIVSVAVTAPDRTIGFRISSDPMAASIIDAFMDEYGAPLTCTSANVSGLPTLNTPSEILQQFGPKAHLINEIHDDGPRKGLATTVVKVVDSEITVLREGNISEAEIRAVLV